ncbi:MAG: SDR family NAD(P)-dependent oxidoreductase [Porticoccaceae bacterium]|jgi:short-subunit dehydrogenase|nr:SDR family NAD(P)-dependent oxidoreductase [Porticoccaceae bacterium]
MAAFGNFPEKYGNWALISGGAQGIGAAYGERLAAMGMSLVLLDINAAALEQTASQLRRDHPGVEIRPIPVDLGDAAALNAAIDSLDDIEIGLLVANAGLGAVGRWLDVPLEVKLNQIAVNCASPVILAHRLTPGMVARGRGGVIIMASGSAEMGASYIATYAATKAFDRVFAEGLWSELERHGIDVTTVMPGAVNTPGFRASLPPGQAPTRLMQPVDPFVVVDAALGGLGREINVRPNAGPITNVLMGLMLGLLPRKRFLRMGDKAVRAMYDR